VKRFVALALCACAAAAAQDSVPRAPAPPDGQAAEPPAQDAGAAEQDAGPGDAGADAELPRRNARPGPDADLARKDVHVALIHLQVAKLYVTGLYDLAGTPTVWDKERGISLFTQAQNATADAERTVAELSGLAKGEWAKAAEPLRRARGTLAHVQSQLRSLAVPVRGAGGQGKRGEEILREIDKSLDSARSDLETAAKAMNVDTKLRKP
jgi:exonuclease VII small subunit